MHRQEQEHAHQRASFSCTARDSLGKNSLKKCVCDFKGKITLFSFPKEHRVRWTVDAVFCFFRGSNGVSQVCLLTNFYKQGPVRCWICISFDTERWNSPSYKRSRSWIRTSDVSETASNVCFVRNRHKWSSLFSSALSMPPGARLFSERIVNVYLSFINIIKLNTFLEIWRRQYYSIGT